MAYLKHLFSRTVDSRKIDFIIAGTQKGGTSALAGYLSEHPDVHVAHRKEVHYFDGEDYFRTGTPDYSTYHASFDSLRGSKLTGEATPIYMYWYASPRRMWEYNPNLKLIMILRNPIERAYSHWNMERHRKADSASFIAAIAQEAERCREALPLQHRVYSYTDRGFYTDQLRRMWHFFPRARTLVIKSEDLARRPQETMDLVCGFLEVPGLPDVGKRTVHARPYVSTMTAAERKVLQDRFALEIRNLERLLDWNCEQWLEE